MAAADPIMDRLRREERAFTRRLVLILIPVAVLGGAFGWWVGTWPPRPILIQFDQPLRVQVQIAPEKP
jgi:hypothetical protein